MSMIDEAALEAAFWAFDEERRRTGAERDAFKHTARALLRAHMQQVRTLLTDAEMYVRAYKTGFDAPKGKDGASRCLREIGDYVFEREKHA